MTALKRRQHTPEQSVRKVREGERTLDIPLERRTLGSPAQGPMCPGVERERTARLRTTELAAPTDRIVLSVTSPGYSPSYDTTGERAVGRTNLFELLGRPVAAAVSDHGTFVTASPDETYDDDSVLPSIEDLGTAMTRTVETYDDDSMFPSAAESGTLVTRSNFETYDDDAVLPLM